MPSRSPFIALRARSLSNQHARRSAIRRAIRRARQVGFTLTELMVVVVIISVVAVLAIPSLQTAREDRLVFRTAAQFANYMHDAQMRSQARGAAQLIMLTTSGNTIDRGTIVTFASVDPTGHPVSACKNNGEWAGVPAGSPQNAIIDGTNANTGAGTLAITAGIQSTLAVNAAPFPVVLVCFTPGGRVYVSPGPDVPTALAALPGVLPFTGTVTMSFLRKPGGGAAVGITRTVIMTGSGGMRLQST